MTRRLITADASKVSGAEFLRSLLGDPNDISGCLQTSTYFLRDGAWHKIMPHHVGVNEQIVEVEHLGPGRIAA
jgi:hypothetical protein